ncbi:cysteine desulfurase family protein [Rhodococcus sp. 2H158]
MTVEHPGLPARPVYLDYNATTPVDPRVVEALLPALRENFGNPSSDHAFGAAPKAALRLAREQVAAFVGSSPQEIVFTGSGSEADALAIRGVVLAAMTGGQDKAHVITQVTEHPAVLAACRALHDLHGVEITYLPVDGHGILDPTDVEAAITSRTVLVTVMHANNETGTVQPIREIADVTRRHGVFLHSDAAQSAGKITLDVGAFGVDLLTVVGHKMYAPKGIAALYVRDGVSMVPLIGGGGQERGVRAGTENVAFAMALGIAGELAATALVESEPHRLAVLRDRLVAMLSESLPGRVHLHGHPSRRLPNTANLRIDGAEGPAVLAAAPDIAASTGSACHSGTHEPSPVLRAMGIEHDAALGAIRLSLGRWTRETDVVVAAEAISRACATVRRTSGGE